MRNMAVAFAWARVSSKDQEQMGNSIPEQMRRIHSFAASQDIRIVREFTAGESAFQSTRDEFQFMVGEALRDRPNVIIVDDSSRFARNRKDAITYKELLQTNGIRLLFASEPNLDPDSLAGFWLNGIQELKNEATSREIRYHTMKGMKGNIQHRDPETGWCYKNGGRVPYGWRKVTLERGHNQKGKPILKVVWDIDEDKSRVARLIIVDLYVGKQLSYKAIRDYLNAPQNSIPGPEGRVWGTSTIVEMLRDNRLEQYAGYGFWNKVSRKSKGQKFNDRDQWVIVRNAHPAIITEDELKAALARRGEARQNAKYARTKDSPYLFTGKNLEGQPMFICADCGGNVIGECGGKTRHAKYICGPSRYTGKAACASDLKVDKDWLEDSVIDMVRKRYTQPQTLDSLVSEVVGRLKNSSQDYSHALDDIRDRRQKAETEKSRLLAAIKSGMPYEFARHDIEALTATVAALDTELDELKRSAPTTLKVTPAEVREFFTSFAQHLDDAPLPEKKRLIRTFVRRLELDGKQKEVRITFYPDPSVFCIGVGSGT